MPLQAGTQLGEYEIVALLGAGGMGEVYRARDPRLGREVAIKVLSAEAAGDRGLLQRLQQEARTVAALNHPNLLAIFDLGTHQGAPFLVMELLNGETMRTRLQRGPLSPRAAIATGLEIARGLAAAHEQGVVHRDLKPENIFLLSDGRAKILDFGLAKSGSVESAAEAATLAGSAATVPGMVMGTVGYMAPEQVRGEAASTRSDIFAFGTILYEMLAGKRAFAASSAVEVMSAILRDEAPELPSGIGMLPPGLERIVRRCLEKDPRRRFQSAADLEFALLNLETTPSSSAVPALPGSGPSPAVAVPGRARPRTRPYAALALTALVAVALTCLFTLDRGGPDLTAVRMTPFVPEAAETATGHWSPDGMAVAFAASPSVDSADQVFVRYLNAPDATQLTNIPNLDGVLGWSADGHGILYDDHKNVWSVASVGGAPRLVGSLGPHADSINGMDLSPHAWAVFRNGDGQFDVFTSAPGGGQWQAYAPAPFASTNLVNTPGLAFSPDGTRILLFMNGARGREEAWLLPWPADPRHPPRPVFPQLPQLQTTPRFSWLPDSRHVLISAQTGLNQPQQIYLADTQGSLWQQLTADNDGIRDPAVSPDATAAVVAIEHGHFDVDVARLSNGVVSPLLANGADNNMPAWALRAPVLVYESTRNGAPSLWLHSVNGAQVQERPLPIAGAGNLLLAPMLSPHADRVLFSGFGQASGAVPLYIASVSGGSPVPLLSGTPGIDVAASWSPDGNQAVYIHIQGNIGALMITPTSGGATPRLLRADINSMVPVWSPDGAWIAYQAADDSMHLISPDGQRDRNLGKLDTRAVAFSPDSRRLYGISSSPGHNYLFSLDLSSGAQQRIGDLGAAYVPETGSSPGLRFTLTPDGQGLTFNSARLVRSLWLMRGFPQGPQGMAKVRAWLHLP